MRVDPLFHLGLPNALNTFTGRENTLSQQLSSGLRVASASDDPIAAANGVRLGSAIAADDAYTTASSGVESRLQVADTVLGTVVSQVTAAIALVVKGANGTLDAANVQAVGLQIAGIRDQVLTLANTSYAGGYLFSGTRTDTQPFATTAAGASYAGDAQTPYLRTPRGQQIAVGLAGDAVFSAAGADVLGSLERLAAGFAAGQAQSSTAADLEELRRSLAHVSTQRGTLGAALNSLEQTSIYAASEETSLKAAQTASVSANAAQVASDLSATETQQKALLSVMSVIQKTNLFDYLR